MDVILKRRLVGAGVIGVIAMVVVPMFLDGPDWQEQDERPSAVTSRNSQGERVVTVPLYGNSTVEEPVARVSGSSPTPSENSLQNPQADNQARQRAERERSQREAELALEQRREQRRQERRDNELAERQRLESQRRAAEQQQTTSVRPSVPAQTDRKGWAVQLGTFSNQGNAERLLKKLEANGRSAWVSMITNRSGKSFYRVRVGPESSREEADKTAIQLAKQFSLQPRVMDLR